MPPPISRFVRRIIALLALGVSGALIAWWMAERADQELRVELLQRGQLVAQALSLSEIRALAGAEADLDRTEYRRLKEQLAAVRQADPRCRFLYLTGQNAAGAVFFYVDSEPAGSRDYSPPGEPYAEVSEIFRQVFTTKTAAVEGPVSDRWGVWISALVPLTDPATGKLVAVMGMDIDARTWRWDVTGRAALPVVLMFLILIGAASLLVSTCKAPIISPDSWPAGRFQSAPWIVLVTSLLLFGAGSLYMKSNVELNAKLEFNSRCDRICNLVTDRLEDHARVLASGSAFFQASERVTRDEWRLFTQRQHSEKPLAGMQGVGFSLLIPRAELPRHLREIRGAGFPQYTVKPEGDREVYSAIIYLEPFADRNLRAFGFDMLSEPVRRAAMEKARDTGSAALSGKVVLVQETAEDVQAGALLYSPVYRRGLPIDTVEQRRTAIMGWVYSAYRMNDFITGILGVRNLDFGEQLNLQVFDGAQSSPESELYGTLPPAHRPWWRWTGFQRQTTITVNGHSWTLAFTQAGHDLFSAEYAKLWLTVVGGISIALLFFALTRVLLNTNKEAQRMAQKLTRELRESEESYRNQFAKNSTAMLLIDPDSGAIVEANTAAVAFYGYSRAQLLGMRSTEINLLPESDVRQAMASVRREEGRSLEFHHRLADGSVRAVEVSSSRIQFGGRNVLHSIITDVTERKQLEIAREEALGRLQKIASRVPGVVYQFRLYPDGRSCFPFASEAIREIYRVSPEEVRTDASKVFSVLHPEDYDGIIASIQQSAREQSAWRHEYRVKFPDGTVRWLAGSALPQREEDGSVLWHGFITDITERKRTEEIIKASAAWRKALMDSASYAIIATTPDGLIETFNPAAERMLGYSAAEVIGKASPALIHDPNEIVERSRQLTAELGEEVAPGFDVIVARARRNLPNETEWTYVRKDGSRFPVLLAVAVVRDSTGGIAGFMGLAQDITERKRAEETLRQTTDRLALATRAGGVGIWDFDVVENRFVWDDEMLRLYGINRTQFAAAYDAWQAAVHPEDRQRTDGEFQLALAGMKEFDTEFRVRWPDGSIHSIRALANVQRDAANRPVRVVGTNWDITALKRAEAELLRKERQFRFIFEVTPIGISWRQLRPDGSSTFLINDAHLKICGIPREQAEVPGIFQRITHPDDLRIQRQLEVEMFAGRRRSFQIEKRYLRPDGKTVWVLFSTSWRQDADGTGESLSAVVDITARKKVEAELQETNRYLQDATARANSMAAEAAMANATKSEFLANMSHEIRTPMNGVIGMTELLLETSLDEDQRRYAETVRASSEALLGLLNDILDFSKFEAGKLSLETLDFNLSALLDDFSSLLALRAQDRNLEFICATGRNVPVLLRGDPGRLRQVLLNLAGNALKFTEKGEVAVRVSVVTEQAREVVLRFSVKDTGIGIPADKQGILFQKFTQVDASTTRQYGGTGLGLAISKQLAEMMGGQIGLESSPGHGSEFWFTVRLGKQPVATPPVVSPPPAELRGTRVLVVDDNATHCQVLGSQLETWGVHAEAVQNGPAAIHALHRALRLDNPFRSAIIDLQMPGTDGPALIRAIRADAALSDTRLILMTSIRQREDVWALDPEGSVACLVKPVRQSELRAALQMALSAEPSPRPALPAKAVAPGEARLKRFAGRSARILLAEDNLTNQLVANAMLKTMGLHAEVAANGAEAVKALETQSFDLVLMDAQMPEMDGLEATRQIRSPNSRARSPRVPIIAMTANVMPGDREQCLAAGMDDYIAKPVSPQTMADILDQWLPRAIETPATSAAVANEAAAPAGQAVVPIFDRKELQDRLMYDEQLMHKVITCFLQDTPRQIAALRNYLASGDIAGARRQAHTLSSASANVGGKAMRALVIEIETAAKTGHLATGQARLPGLEAQFRRLRAVMEEELALIKEREACPCAS